MGTTTVQMDSKDSVKSMESILYFRDELLAREILSCGVGKSDKILHFGSGYSNNLLFSYISDLKSQKLIEDLSVIYHGVDVNEQSLEKIFSKNSNTENPLEIRLFNKSMQLFLDENEGDNQYKWTVITGIFDEKTYKENQFDFIDKMISESLKISEEGIICSFLIDENEENYNIQDIISYIDSVYSSYKISRLNEKNYVICIHKYYHSIIQQ